MGWYAYFFFLGWLIAKADWTGVFREVPIDCTHSWENDHCYVCGEDR